MRSADSRYAEGRRFSARWAGPAIASAVLFAACRTTNAPRPYRVEPESLAARVTGSWVEVERRDRAFVRGELVAAVGDTLFTVDGNRLDLTPADAIRRVTLTRYRPDIGALVVWTLLGTASTASHGFGLILSAPLWLITGIATSAAETRRAIIVTTDFAELSPWARFPAGIPASVDRSKLHEAIPASTPP